MTEALRKSIIDKLRKQREILNRAHSTWTSESFEEWKRETKSLLDKLGISVDGNATEDSSADDVVWPIIVHGGRNGGEIHDLSKPERRNSMEIFDEIERWKEFLDKLLIAQTAKESHDVQD